MVAPKRKHSKQRKNLRRSAVWKLTAPTLAVCPSCGEYMLPHRACKACGKYKGRDVTVLIQEEAAKPEEGRRRRGRRNKTEES